MPEQYLEKGHKYLLPHPFQFCT